MAGEELEDVLERPFLFRERPASAPGDMRPVWRLPVVLMLVRSCRGEKATHEQLHVLSWALRSAEGAESLAAFLEGALRPEQAVVRFEPALDRALNLACGFELLTWDSRYWKLTNTGMSLLKGIDADGKTLASEKATLNGLKGKLSQAAVERLLKRGAP